jgi:hypothetical protein
VHSTVHRRHVRVTCDSLFVLSHSIYCRPSLFDTLTVSIAGPGGRSPTETVGTNPAGGRNVSMLWVLCVVRYRSLRRTDLSSREVLPTVVCLCDLEPSSMRRPWSTGGGGGGCRTKKKQTKNSVKSCCIQMMLCPVTFMFDSFYVRTTWILSRAKCKHAVTHSPTERQLTTELQCGLLVCNIHTYLITCIQIFLLPPFLLRIAIYHLYTNSWTKSEWKKRNIH